MSRMSAQTRVPLGTRVVVHGTPADAAGPGTGRGLAGRIVRDGGDLYTVALVDGQRVEAHGDQLMSVGDGPAGLPVPVPLGEPADLVTSNTLYAALVGGPDGDPGRTGSEAIVRGVYQAPTRAIWSLRKPPEQVAGPGPAWFSWEVERFCRLALEADPSCHELLWSTRPVWVADAGQELLDLRGAFLSQSISSAYVSYVLAEFKRLDEQEPAQGEQRWSWAAHLLRLLIDGSALLRTGDVAGSAADHRDRLDDVAAGRPAWDQVESWRLELQQNLDEAAAVTFLPAEPDVDRVDAWLTDLRRRDLDDTQE